MKLLIRRKLYQVIRVTLILPFWTEILKWKHNYFMSIIYIFLNSPNLEQKFTGVPGIGKCLPVGKPISKLRPSRARHSTQLYKADYTDLKTGIQTINWLGLYCDHAKKYRLDWVLGTNWWVVHYFENYEHEMWSNTSKCTSDWIPLT